MTTRETQKNPAGAVRRFGRRFIATTVLVGTAATALAGIGVSTASAATAPVSYLTGIQCQSAGKTGYISLNYPTAAAAYNGTTEMYFQAQLQFENASGQWPNSGTAVDGASAYVWGASGSQFTPVYWGGSPYNTPAAIHVKTGNTWRVMGYTYWLIGGNWYYYATNLGSCRM